MQYLWFFIVLAAFVDGIPHWEPCKGQCITNYQRNELIQESLASACQKGCDLLTVSFISTSELVSFKEPVIKPKHSSTLILHLFGNSNKPSRSNEVQKVTTSSTESHKSSPSASSPSKVNKQDNKAVTKVKETHSKAEKQDSTSSKTTVEPTSQPVQDHPVEANRQTTTTNGPRRETKITDPKQKEEVIEVKQKNKDKHIQKHSPNTKHNKQFNGIKEITNSEGFAKIQIHETIETTEHLNMKERLEEAKHTCRQECIATYASAPEQEACVVGCNLQMTTLSLKSIDDTPDSMELPPQSLLGMFQRVIFNLAGHVGKLVRVGWSLFSSSQANAVVEKPQVFGTEGVNRGQPMPQLPQMPFFISLRPTSLQEQVQKRIESIRAEQSNAIKLLNEEFFQKHQPFENSLLFSHHGSHHSLPRIISIFKKESITHHKDKTHHPHTAKPENQRKISKHDQITKFDDDLINSLYITEFPPRTADNQRDSKEQIQHQLDLLECISRKSGLPRWFIAITIFTSAIVVLWLCFSLTAPPDDIKVVKTKPPELDTLLDENDEYEDDELSCSEKKKLLSKVDDVIRVDDVIKINIQTV